MKSWTDRMADEQAVVDNSTDMETIEVAPEQISKLRDYESPSQLALVMEKTALDAEKLVMFTWSRDEALRLAGMLHRLRQESKARLEIEIK